MSVVVVPKRPVHSLSDYDKRLVGHLVGTHSIRHIAEMLGHPESTVGYYARKHNLIPLERRKHVWTPAEDEYIASAVDQGHSYYRISQKLHYPTDLIRHRAYDLGYTAQALNYSVARCAKMFGLSDKVIKDWVRIGALPAYNNGTRTLKHYLISEDAIYEFIETEKWWHLWDTYTIVDGVLRSYAEEIRAGKGWLTAAQAGAALGYTREGLRPYITRGLCRAVMRGQRGGKQYSVREDWLDDARERMKNGGPPWWGDDPLERPLWLPTHKRDAKVRRIVR